MLDGVGLLFSEPGTEPAVTNANEPENLNVSLPDRQSPAFGWRPILKIFRGGGFRIDRFHRPSTGRTFSGGTKHYTIIPHPS